MVMNDDVVRKREEKLWVWAGAGGYGNQGRGTE
jgi:hypothetical protein